MPLAAPQLRIGLGHERVLVGGLGTDEPVAVEARVAVPYERAALANAARVEAHDVVQATERRQGLGGAD